MITNLRVIADVADTAALTAFFSTIVFITGYTVLAPWWRYSVGRAIVSLDGALFATLLPTFLRLVFHVNNHVFFYAWFTIVSLFLVAATTLWRLMTLSRVQHHASQAPTPETVSVDTPQLEDM
jgi:hypothetical protein